MFRRFLSVSFVLLALQTFATASTVEPERRACPDIHVFGARETTEPPGYGSSITVVNDVLNTYPGSTSEAIVYPACGGQSSCGDVSYADSVIQGVAAVASAVDTFNTECPETQLVLVGYSQGAQIMDDAFCGGGDTNEGLTSTAIPIQPSAVTMIAAAIFMSDPRYISGLSYDVGTCEADGFAPRPVGFQCPSAAKIQSYCDASDPYCCNGNNVATPGGFGAEYAAQALTFIEAKLSAAGTGTGTTGTAPPTSTGTSGGGGTVAEYGQCGGEDWTGGTVCVAPFTCQEANTYYSQCLPA